MLLDFGKGDYTGDNEPLINRFKMIIRGNHDHIKVIVALSSGRGGIFNKDEFLRSLVSNGKSVPFINFSDKEASAFCICTDMHVYYIHLRAQNSGLSQVIFRPTSAYDRPKSNLIGQILLYISNGEANDGL